MPEEFNFLEQYIAFICKNIKNIPLKKLDEDSTLCQTVTYCPESFIYVENSLGEGRKKQRNEFIIYFCFFFLSLFRFYLPNVLYKAKWISDI